MFCEKQVSGEFYVTLLSPDVSDSLEIHHLLEMSGEYSLSDPDTAIFLAKKALNRAEVIDNTEGIAVSNRTIGNLLRADEEYTNALQYYDSSLHYYHLLKDTIQSLRVQLDIAVIYNLLGYINKATKLNFSVLHQSDSAGFKKIKARALYNIGEIYRLQKNGPLAVQYLNRAYQLACSTGNSALCCSALHNLALANDLIGKPKLAIEQLKKCFDYAGMIQSNDSARIYNNIGRIYRMLKEFDRAESYLLLSLEIRSRLNNPSGLGHTYNELGTLYNDRGQFSQATGPLEHAYKIAERSGKISLLSDIARNLSDTYKGLGNYEKALKYETAYSDYRFAQFNNENATVLNEMETRYETEKKEQENRYLKNEALANQLIIKRQRWLGILISVLLIVVTLSAIFAYRAYLVRKKLAHRINKQKEKLEQDKEIIEDQAEKLKSMDKLKSQFFANISHEFRTPLTLILGPLDQSLKQKKALSSEEKEIMFRNAKRLLELINQLLDLSRLESGNMKLTVSPIDFVSYIKGLVMSFSSLAAIQEKHIEIHCNSSEIKLYIDREKMDKVLYNLLSNAFKFTQRGDNIVVNVQQNNLMTEIRISDTGIGIPANELPYIFKRFYRTSQTHKTHSQGSGIGLALASQLIELHGGTILVESEVGKGTSFILRLPTGTDHFNSNNTEILGETVFYNEENRLTPEEMTSMKELSVNGKHRNISDEDEIVLIVEDNADVRRYICQSIQNEYKTIEASDGMEGLDKASQYIPDLIISDVMMPEMDGIEFTENIKTDIKTSHIPVILLTAKAASENKIEGLTTGADDYMIKPFMVDELVIRVRNLIDQRRKLRKLFSKNLLAEPEEDTVSFHDKKFLSMTRTAVLANLADENFDVEQLSKKIRISRSNLFRKLRALTDQNPSQYIRSIRLQKAADMLKNENARINEIAFQVGFSNVSYFNKCFKEQFGNTPSGFLDRA